MKKLTLISLVTLIATTMAVFAMASGKKYDYTIPVLSNKDYAPIAKSGKKIAVLYNANWCPSCMAQHKAVSQIYDKYKAKLGIYVVDWDRFDEFAGPKARQRTTIAIIQNDKILEERIGENRVEVISALFDRHTR